MAGSTRPVEELVIEQTRYILSLDGDLSTDDKAKLAELEAEVDKAKSITNAASTKSVLGAPPPYWLDLRRYNAPTTATALKQRTLVLVGGRDYQVTRADFNEWKSALSTRSNVAFKLYPNLNHMFIAGEGKSKPTGYEQPGHIATEVRDDIAHCVAAR